LKFDGNNLPFPEESFDFVCSMGVLHHVSDAAEMFRVLKPGGRLIAMLYHGPSWKNFVLLRLRCRRGRTQREALNLNDGDARPLALVYSRSEAARLFSTFSPIEFILARLSWRQLLVAAFVRVCVKMGSFGQRMLALASHALTFEHPCG
jgi:SAM-dependent methyltransferase